MRIMYKENGMEFGNKFWDKSTGNWDGNWAGMGDGQNDSLLAGFGSVGLARNVCPAALKAVSCVCID